MERLKYYVEKYRLALFLIILIIVLIFFIVFSMLQNDNTNELKYEEISKELEVKEEVIKDVTNYKVDIKGYVKKPGVYELDSNSRVIDVINKAGGLREEANTEYINLSKKITDEMIIIIYSNNDLEKFKETDKQIIYIEYECVCPDNINDVCISKEDIVNTNGVNEDIDINTYDNKVSINKGTLEELMTLNGIGESKAKAIIEYREENGNFKDINEIKNVSGIGEAAYSKIKDNIKL